MDVTCHVFGKGFLTDFSIIENGWFFLMDFSCDDTLFLMTRVRLVTLGGMDLVRTSLYVNIVGDISLW